MDTASSAAVATPMAMVRILLFICIGQLMVTSVNTVEANEFEDKLNKQERHINAGYNRYDGLGWKTSDPGCDFLDTSHTVDSAPDCLIECTANEECTAVNYRENDGFCRLIKCDLPVQEPTASASGYVGYSVKQGDCQHFGGVIFDDKCLYLSEDSDTKTWQGAKDECSRKNGELAMFSDDPYSILNFIEERSTTSTIYWIGGSDRSHESNWEWDNGETIPLDHFEFPWGPGEPNGEGDENCLDVSWYEADNGYRYNDNNCLDEHGYICEIGCSFNGTIYPPGTFIQKACAQLQCDGTTGKFKTLGYDEHCSRCLAYWDPHILNYDQNLASCNVDNTDISHQKCGSYRFNMCSNYSLTQIGSSVEPPFAVYSTFERCGGTSTYVTCVDTVTFKNDGNTIITIAYDTNEDKLKIQVNGNDVKADVLSTSPSIVQDTSGVVYPVIAWTSVYKNVYSQVVHDTTCVSLQGSSGILVRYCGDSLNYASTVLVWASHEIAITELRGLCGIPNNDKTDDYMKRDGTLGHLAPTYDFPLSWLVSGDSNGICASGRNNEIKTENKCEANSSFQENFQSQCKDSVNLGFSDGGIDLSQILIDDCVHDLCNVTDPNKWMGSVHGALPVHAEIKEKTAGHCHHKRNHKCKTHSGTCIMKSETCDGTIIERGCHGKKCICCAPNPCDQTSTCLAKQGKCILRKDWAGCDGNVNTELCSGSDCGCCYTKSPKKVKERKKCLKMNGKCMQKDNWGNCGGILKIRWCKGKKWACCYTT